MFFSENTCLVNVEGISGGLVLVHPAEGSVVKDE